MRTLSLTFLTLILCLLLKNAQGDMSLDEMDRIKGVAKASTVMDSLSFIFYALYSFFSPADPSLMIMMSLNRMFEYAKFINTGYPEEAQYMFYLQGFDVGLKPGVITNLQVDSVKYFKNSQMTGTAFSFYLYSSSFFINYFPCLLKLLVLGILLALFFFLIKCFARDPEEDSKLRNFMSLLRWNVFILILFGTCAEITLFSVLELRSANFANFFSVISFFVCAIMMVIALTFFGRLVQITLGFRKVYNNKMTSQSHAQEMSEIISKWREYKPYFGIYKRSFLQQGHLLIFVVRIFFFSFFLGTLFEYPVLQSVLYMLMTFGMIVYLLIMRPFIKLINLIGQITLEILLFIYYICVLALAVKDSKQDVDMEGRERIGTVLIVFSLLAQVFTLLFVLLKVLLLGKKMYLARNSQEKIPMEVEEDIKQDKTSYLNNSHLSGKNLMTGVNDSVISKPGDLAGNGENAINILDQSGRVPMSPSLDNNNGVVILEQDNAGPGLSKEEIAVIEARKRYLIEQSRGLYTQQAKKSRRPRIIRPQMQLQPQPQPQLQLQNNLNSNLSMMNNYGMNGNHLYMVQNNGNHGNMMNMTNKSGNGVNTDRSGSFMVDHNGNGNMLMNNHNNGNNGHMNMTNMNRNMNAIPGNLYSQREGNFAMNGNLN